MQILLILLFACSSRAFTPDLGNSQAREVGSAIFALRSLTHRFSRLRDLRLRFAAFEQTSDSPTPVHSGSPCSGIAAIRSELESLISEWEQSLPTELHIDITSLAHPFMAHHNMTCLEPVLEDYTRQVVQEGTYHRQSALDLRESLEHRRALASVDYHGARFRLNQLKDVNFRLLCKFRRYMFHFVPIVNYLLSFSRTDGNNQHPSNETLVILAQSRERIEPIMRDLMSIANIHPFWSFLPVGLIDSKFYQLRSEITQTLAASSEEIPNHHLWLHVLEPIYRNFRMSPQIYMAELDDRQEKLNDAQEFETAVTRYLHFTSTSIASIDQQLAELDSFGFNWEIEDDDASLSVSSAEEEDDESGFQHIVSGVSRLVEE